MTKKELEQRKEVILYSQKITTSLATAIVFDMELKRIDDALKLLEDKK